MRSLYNDIIHAEGNVEARRAGVSLTGSYGKHTINKNGPIGSCGMAEVFICKDGDIENGSRRIVEANGIEVGIYRYDNRYYAYRNICLHQGGPVCEGELVPKVEDVLGPDKTWVSHRFNENDMHIVCPWHSYEFSLKTGVCASDSKMRLQTFKVLERDGSVYVNI